MGALAARPSPLVCIAELATCLHIGHHKHLLILLSRIDGDAPAHNDSAGRFGWFESRFVSHFEAALILRASEPDSSNATVSPKPNLIRSFLFISETAEKVSF
jgi:hypothetical protein